jgi:hypothetical protein
VKYDRPVWQIMHACADAMPVVFRYEDVRTWFADHFPDVNEATIRAHLIGMTDGGRAKHVQFAQRSPVFRRIARGEYEAIPPAERGESPDVVVPSPSKVKMSGNGAHLEDRGAQGRRAPATKPPGNDRQSATPSDGERASEIAPDDEEPEPLVPDVVLLGSLGERVNVPAPAKEVFREVAFQLARIEAELGGGDWFVLSAEHGLVAPDEWMSPDSRTLDDLDTGYRVAWASWVVTRLESLVGPVDGTTVRVDAPDAIVGPLFTELQDAGALVTSGRAGGVTPALRPRAVPSEGDWTGHEAFDPAPVAVVEEPAPEGPTLAPVLDLGTRSPVAAHLLDPDHVVPASKAGVLPDVPGLYAWMVDPVGARELNRCLQLPVRAGLLFVGQVGGSRWHAATDPALTLVGHVDRVQLRGRSRASTFRMTLATVLRQRLSMTSLEDPRLTEWMLEHLSVSWWAEGEPGELHDLEQAVVRELAPPLNVDHDPASEYRTRLGQLRSALA